MKRAPNGWDERDYKLWSALRCLPSYGLIAGDQENIMISRKEVEALLEVQAERRCARKRVPGGESERAKESK